MTRALSIVVRQQFNEDDRYYLPKNIGRHTNNKGAMTLEGWATVLYVDMAFMHPELRDTEAGRILTIIDESIRWNI